MRKQILPILFLWLLPVAVGYAEEVDLAGLQAQLSDANVQLETLQADNAALKQRVADKENELAEIKAKLDAIDAEISALKAQAGTVE